MSLGTQTDDITREVCAAICANRAPPAASSESESLFQSLAGHGLSGIARKSSALADPLREKLEERWRTESRHVTALDLETIRVARAVATRGIPRPILLKGRSVARRYADPSARNYVDIDLLVRPSDLGPWHAVLTDLGYSTKSEWQRRASARYQHEIGYSRASQAGWLICELHTCLFVERTARRIGFDVLVAHAQESPLDPAVLELDDAALLVVLSLHLAHHDSESRKMIWYRDFVELGSDAIVARARLLSSQLGVGWALEQALTQTQDIIGAPRWNARSAPETQFGLRRVQNLGASGFAYHLAIARELGPTRGAGYLASRFDPRRFVGRDREPFGAWTARVGRSFRSTPWRRVFSRKQ